MLCLLVGSTIITTKNVPSVFGNNNGFSNYGKFANKAFNCIKDGGLNVVIDAIRVIAKTKKVASKAKQKFDDVVIYGNTSTDDTLVPCDGLLPGEYTGPSTTRDFVEDCKSLGNGVKNYAVGLASGIKKECENVSEIVKGLKKGEVIKENLFKNNEILNKKYEDDEEFALDYIGGYHDKYKDHCTKNSTDVNCGVDVSNENHVDVDNFHQEPNIETHSDVKNDNSNIYLDSKNKSSIDSNFINYSSEKDQNSTNSFSEDTKINTNYKIETTVEENNKNIFSNNAILNQKFDDEDDDYMFMVSGKEFLDKNSSKSINNDGNDETCKSFKDESSVDSSWFSGLKKYLTWK